MNPTAPSSSEVASRFWRCLDEAAANAAIVLIVEDQPSQRQSVEDRVRNLIPDAMIISAASSEDARKVLEQLRRKERTISIAILDLVLPVRTNQSMEPEIPDRQLPWAVRDHSPQSIRVEVSAAANDLEKLKQHLRDSGQSLESLEEQGTYFLAKDESWPRSLRVVLEKARINRKLEGSLIELDEMPEAPDWPGRLSHGRARGRAEDTWLREVLLAEEARAHWHELFPGLRMRLSQRLSLNPDTGERILEAIDTTNDPPGNSEEPESQT